jgi:hypothetical protein
MVVELEREPFLFNIFDALPVGKVRRKEITQESFAEMA